MSESNGLTTTESSDKHRLSSQGHGESQIEILATRIETRRENRIALPFRLRVAIIDTFYKISVEEKYRDRNRVHLEDVVRLVKKEEESDKSMLSVLQTLGFFNEKALKLEVYERAKRVAEETKDDGWLYYRDFMVRNDASKSIWR
jgi:poly(A) polymerase Pap1